MSPLKTYISAWRAHDVDAMLATLRPDAVVIESHGPLYRGHDRIKQWMLKWTTEGGQVLAWDVNDMVSTPGLEIAQWNFRYVWNRKPHAFEGATIAKLTDGKISHLREYATTAPVYDWTGEWRT